MTPAQAAEKIQRQPRWFCEDVLGRNPWDKQVEIIEAVFKHRRVAVAGCVSSSKTNAAAMLVLAWLFAFPRNSRVFTLAPSYRQVDVNLWGELPRMHAAARIPLGGKMLETTEYKPDPRYKNWYALGFSTKEPEMVHGIHGENDLLVIDDAHAVPEPMFDEVENMMAGGNTHIVLLYNTMRLSGTTYACRHADRARWHNIAISYWDTPNGKAGKPIIPGMLLPDTVKTWIAKYGRDSNFVRVKVDAKAPKQEADTLIPLEHLELALAREVPEPDADSPRAYGQDVARFGDDNSSRCEIHGRKVLPIISVNGQDTMATAGSLLHALSEKPGAVAIDVIGVGSGVYDKVAEEGVDAIAVNVAEKSIEVDEAGKEKYANLRAQLWDEAAWALDPRNPEALQLPPGSDRLIAQLSSVKKNFDSKGRMIIEPKDKMKARLGESPDEADAFCLAVHALKMGTGAGDIIQLVEELA